MREYSPDLAKIKDHFRRESNSKTESIVGHLEPVGGAMVGISETQDYHEFIEHCQN